MLLTPLFDLLFPRTSLTGMPGTWITDDELRSLRGRPVQIDAEVLRERGVAGLDRVVAGGSYGALPALRSAVYTCKYRRVPAVAEALAPLLADAWELLPPMDGPVLCPVPLHWLRAFSRGFNQAEVLACAVSPLIGAPVLPLLRRVRSTGFQAKRAHADRGGAMRGAFACLGDCPSTVVLVDDVCTTGATLGSCATALRARGARRVFGLVLAAA